MDLPEGRYSYRNIGCNIVGWVMEPVSEYTLDCVDLDCNHETEDCYYWVHDFILTDFLEVIWVGDDQVHIVELEDLVQLKEDQEVCSCGQIGCWSSPGDRD